MRWQISSSMVGEVIFLSSLSPSFAISMACVVILSTMTFRPSPWIRMFWDTIHCLISFSMTSGEHQWVMLTATNPTDHSQHLHFGEFSIITLVLPTSRYRKIWVKFSTDCNLHNHRVGKHLDKRTHIKKYNPYNHFCILCYSWIKSSKNKNHFLNS